MSSLILRLNALRLPKIDGAVGASLVVLIGIALLDRDNLSFHLTAAAASLLHTAPYILIAVSLLAYLKASGAEALVARSFEGREHRMILMAALFGGLAPFCSCEVIPFIAGMLALGAPLSAVMAFWLSSPLIDPASLMITAGALGWKFAVAKTVFAVLIGLFGGYVVKAMLGLGFFPSPLRAAPVASCCGSAKIGKDQPRWRVWQDHEARGRFATEFAENGWFLARWLTLAYLLETLMITHVPAEMIARVVGGDGVTPIAISALVGIPAYLNSLIAPPLVAGLINQGMSPGAGMAFMIAGAVSSIPAMTAVFALVRPPVFATYAALGLIVAVLSGLAYNLIA